MRDLLGRRAPSVHVRCIAVRVHRSVHVDRRCRARALGRDPIPTVRGSGYSFDESFASTA